MHAWHHGLMSIGCFYLLSLFLLHAIVPALGLKSLEHALASALAAGRSGVQLRGQDGHEYMVHGLAPSHMRYLGYISPTRRPLHDEHDDSLLLSPSSGSDDFSSKISGKNLRHPPPSVLLEQHEQHVSPAPVFELDNGVFHGSSRRSSATGVPEKKEQYTISGTLGTPGSFGEAYIATKVGDPDNKQVVLKVRLFSPPPHCYLLSVMHAAT